MKALLSSFRCLSLCAAVLLGAGPHVAAFAQNAPGLDEPADTVRIEGRTVTVEVGEDGRLLINGKAVRGDQGPVIVHFDATGGFALVEPGRVWTRRFRSGPPVAFRFEDRPGEDPGFFFDVGRQLELELGPHLGELLDETELLRRYFADLDWEENAEVARMERETRLLAREVRRAEGAERERLERELREQLDVLFDRKMTLRRERIDRLEGELERQRERLRERQVQREQIIERRLRGLLGEEDELAW